MKNITELFNIQYPIVQGGMVWCSGWKLAAAVSNAGGLGLIGAGSMSPDVLRLHIQKCKTATDKPFGVNIPLLYAHTQEIMNVIAQEGVKIVFTSAGNPKIWTQWFHQKQITVVHVVANVKFALKAAEAGVDAIVAEGFEAGGHNGADEITTLVLLPQVVKKINIPVIAAGGIASGEAMLAAFVLGAKGVQMGSRFAASVESSAHDDFKNKILELDDTATKLTLKKIVPVRLIKNSFFHQAELAIEKGADKDVLSQILGRGRAKLGMFEGDLDNGELEIGQVAGLINEILPAKQIIDQVMKEFEEAKRKMMNC